MRFLLLFLLFSSVFSTELLAQTSAEEQSVSASNEEQDLRYISDELFIFLHAGPSRDFRIVGSINAGTPVSLLQVDREAGYAQVQDSRERVGWVESKFVSRIPSLKVAIEDANDKLAAQQEALENMQQRMNNAISNFNDAEQQKLKLNRSLTKSLEDYAELERRMSKKGRSDRMEWFTRGTVLALISVFFGYLLGFFGRKKSKSNPLL